MLFVHLDAGLSSIITGCRPCWSSCNSIYAHINCKQGGDSKFIWPQVAIRFALAHQMSAEDVTRFIADAFLKVPTDISLSFAHVACCITHVTLFCMQVAS